MPASSESGDSKRLRMIPPLRSRCQNEREPMRRDRRMKKRDGESRDRDGSENRFVHIRKKCGRSLSSSRFVERLSGWWDLNPRPPGPEPGALPNCATARTYYL